jgi:hypothetical protein
MTARNWGTIGEGGFSLIPHVENRQPHPPKIEVRSFIPLSSVLRLQHGSVHALQHATKISPATALKQTGHPVVSGKAG